jgi:hypothetical protein
MPITYNYINFVKLFIKNLKLIINNYALLHQLYSCYSDCCDFLRLILLAIEIKFDNN